AGGAVGVRIGVFHSKGDLLRVRGDAALFPERRPRRGGALLECRMGGIKPVRVIGRKYFVPLETIAFVYGYGPGNLARSPGREAEWMSAEKRKRRTFFGCAASGDGDGCLAQSPRST